MRCTFYSSLHRHFLQWTAALLCSLSGTERVFPGNSGSFSTMHSSNLAAVLNLHSPVSLFSLLSSVSLLGTGASWCTEEVMSLKNLHSLFTWLLVKIT